MASEEAYLVDGVEVEFANKKHKATLTREDQVVVLEAKDRHDLLLLVGDALSEDFGLANSAVWGLYNVVKLK